ncbi:uncharacterized protein [Physcomitrium patens]|uniref:F-box domain-containing protein n=1 Tax=Physcomitrium patens TaxID=3218 RepID=A0A2K1INQ7_PHYPA|nr:uncharacterized protein LOC112274926 [Physcomitrium patens]XP_024360552.1 uncharacterized protein LOC112274926 [Physcomitrium patens]PNR30888.1 hypothetical protein PHYPA_027204 [Physcomitrium patens]|eukprot:XP_024360551.1 uncharacterized protein LOC112274926 [Physcomitrella patens]
MSWISPNDLDIGQTWNSLPPDIQGLILAHLDLTELFKAARVCKSFRDVLLRDSFKQLRPRLRPIECTLGPLLFCVEKKLWHLWGFDWKCRSWCKLPPFTDRIPAPDPELFKDFLVAGHHSLICANMGKASEPEKLYIFNPLTGEAQQLPPLNYRRHPVVISLQVTTPGRPDFRVIAVGSAAVGKGHLSKKTEVYCSVKRRWEVVGDVPGEEFSLNDYQTGVYCETQKLLLCTGFMVDKSKGILAFDVGTNKWRAHWHCPFFRLRRMHTDLTIHFSIAQLVECNGFIYLFSEQEISGTVTHCIDRLDLGIEETYSWTRRLTLSRRGTRALLVYPEFTCVPVQENKLCIFNTVQRTGDVYDMSEEAVNISHYQCLPTPPPLGNKTLLYSLNPLSYSFQPSFGAVLPYL